MAPSTEPRLPDFFVIGAMKSGTTTLFNWLRDQPEVFMSTMKESNFFSFDSVWRRGVPWYLTLFSDAEPGQLLGEGSGYYSPDHGPVAAQRMATVVPGARLVFTARNPVDRMRSHYRHEVQRGRERRPFTEAILGDSPYVRYSEYHQCLSPFTDRFDRAQFCVVRFEDIASGNGAWPKVLDHLGLDHRPPPTTIHNVTEEKPRYSAAFGRIYRTAAFKRAYDRVPAPVRRIGRRLALRPADARYHALLNSAADAVSDEVAERLACDAEAFAYAFNDGEQYWNVTSE